MAKCASEHRILGKIRKCLNLALSSNKHEAETALKQAHALMRKHGVAIGEKRLNTCEVPAPLAASKEANQLFLAVVCRYTHVSAFYSVDCNDLQRVFLVGDDLAIGVAQYLIAFLTQRLEQDSDDYFANLLLQSPWLSRSSQEDCMEVFVLGWLAGVEESIKEFSGDMDDATAAEHCDFFSAFYDLDIDDVYGDGTEDPTINSESVTDGSIDPGSNRGLNALHSKIYSGGEDLGALVSVLRPICQHRASSLVGSDQPETKPNLKTGGTIK